MKANRKTKEARIGESRLMNCGQYATIVAYNNCADISVRFEDGTTRDHVAYRYFKTGKIGLEGRHTSSKKDARLGEETIASNGMKMQIIAYNGSKSIDVKFEDGVVVQNKQYGEFRKGRIGHPHKSNHVGERVSQKCGQFAEIIKYHDSKHCDVLFDSGVVRRGVRYCNFSRGILLHPEVYDKRRINHVPNFQESKHLHIGETVWSKEGYPAIITQLVDFRFFVLETEDGKAWVTKKCFEELNAGNWMHPRFSVHDATETFFGFSLKRVPEFSLADGRRFYSCKCNVCGQKDVMTQKEMYEHFISEHKGE